MRKIYITHCSATKDDRLKDTGEAVTPDRLYTASTTIVPFMRRCKLAGVEWAIFSDEHGVWFPGEKHTWYEKNPNDITDEEFKALVANFDDRLQDYDEIWFKYIDGRRCHWRYRQLMTESQLKGRIRHLRSINDIPARGI